MCHTPCLGGKRPSENAVAAQPVCFSDGLSVANRNGGDLELQFGFQPVVVGRILVSDIPRGGMILRENVRFENPTYNTSLMLRFQTASLCQPSAGCSVPAARVPCPATNARIPQIPKPGAWLVPHTLPWRQKAV
ncbi:hypothetical protein HMPREF9123_1576 [Neisseria bacilliformis ATCC BAA-1200]|uniref:Uncharacterized protein n=1 Tax=Neisseria bacilliformis ATCC BAA-1200 TaxID=888742 RepID=F2BCU6_9NEIS|nr:hypothetical protein HMPREF9123_1576 [Neisseria bacilliformis ATCC BAA-1200]